jgi:dephospho-CoA kinase
MSAWPGKYVIGLTGNIATGKSVVRKMMEHLGAYGIDADTLGHRAIAKDAPGYQAVVDTFGKWILTPDGQVDRSRLSKVVFADPQALEKLEAIVHPLVRQAVDVLIRRASQQVIVIEAIKLLESPLRQTCDTIFVTYARPEIQLTRLMQKRDMNEDIAFQRIATQPSQEGKVALANFVIRNEGSFEDTWRQVTSIWKRLFPSLEIEPEKKVTTAKGEMVIDRARPRQASEIAHFITQVTNHQRSMTYEDVMAAFSEKAFLMLRTDSKLLGLVGWQVENLVSRTDDVYLHSSLPLLKAMQMMMEEVERASRDLQCEASLLFLSPELARHVEMWRALGYEPRTIQSLGVRAWQEAAEESMPLGSVLLFKQLRKDRVLRPV